ncbi:class I SAM-dependent methyltransferase [Methylomagnum sp.]
MDQAADAQAKWDRIYRGIDTGGIPEPARVLTENAHLLPTAGAALDLASGLGGNALFLARRGLETHAVDISAEAIGYLEILAGRLNLPIRAEVGDIVLHPPSAGSFDVIVVSRFLDRSLAAPLMAALRPKGLLCYQTYTREKATVGGPSNPDFLLAPNELLKLFAGLRVVVYREEGLLGDLAQGFRNQALFVGQKI